jgi:hypothetical protein
MPIAGSAISSSHRPRSALLLTNAFMQILPGMGLRAKHDCVGHSAPPNRRSARRRGADRLTKRRRESCADPLLFAIVLSQSTNTERNVVQHGA